MIALSALIAALATYGFTYNSPPHAQFETICASSNPVNTQIMIDIYRKRLTLTRPLKPPLVFHIAPGKDETPSPIGQWTIATKHKDWGGGFGTRWLGLNVPWGVYGIHGTNKPHLIGRRVSSGCIRMNNRSVEKLYPLVPVGTKVLIEGNPLGTPYADPRSLSEGSRGSDVLLIQTYLWYLGRYQGTCNGIFDDATEYALLRFEQKANIPVDGIVDMTDYRALGLIE